MGKADKSSKEKARNLRNVPAALKCSYATTTTTTTTSSSAIEVDTATTAVPAILKLSSVEENERAWACAAVSNIFQHSDPSSRKLLLSQDAVRLLVEKCTDSSLGVVLEATGALSNLALSATPEEKVLGEMLKHDVMTPLSSLCEKVLFLDQTTIG